MTEAAHHDHFRGLFPKLQDFQDGFAATASALGLETTDSAQVLGWYDAIVDSVTGVAAGRPTTEAGRVAFEELRTAIEPSLVRGKVWPRAEKEPSQWTIQFEDPTPNREGSPALYGYAAGTSAPLAEAYYDNVKVTPNK